MSKRRTLVERIAYTESMIAKWEKRLDALVEYGGLRILLTGEAPAYGYELNLRRGTGFVWPVVAKGPFDTAEAAFAAARAHIDRMEVERKERQRQHRAEMAEAGIIIPDLPSFEIPDRSEFIEPARPS